MEDSCCPIEFICEHYLTFPKSKFSRHSLFFEPKKKLLRNPKNQRVFDREKRELENHKGANMNIYLHLKWLF